MKNEDRIVELLAESLQRLDQMVERQNQMVERQNKTTEEIHGLRTEMDKRFERMENRFERIEGILERLAIGFNEFVDIHRETVKAQNDRIGNLERRMDRLEGRG